MRPSVSVLLTGILVAVAACSNDPTATPDNQVTVRPNPVTRETLQELSELYPSPSNPTGLRIIFDDLPAAPCLISVFDQSGELVIAIEKDNTPPSVSWWLGNSVGLRVGTGTYHFAANLKDGTFIDRGTFSLSF